MNKYYGIIVSCIAGLSTLLGYFSIYIPCKKEPLISKSLYFASGVMLTLSFIDLIPSGIDNLSYNGILNLLVCILVFFAGFLICNFFSKTYSDENNLYKTGILSMIAIIVHNVPEGIATYVLSSMNLKLGILFSIAIIFHNIPEGITISIPIYYSTNSKFKAFIYTFISGISEPFGALVAMLFLYKYINGCVIGILFCLIAGIMTYISYELILTSEEYDKKDYRLFFFAGALFIVVVEILLKL